MKKYKDLPSGKTKEHKEYKFSHTPLGYKLRSFIEFNVVNTLEDIDNFKALHVDQADFIDDVLIELIDLGLIAIEDGIIKRLEINKFSSAKTDYARRSLAQLSKEIFDNGVKSYYDGTGDKGLEFGVIATYPDEPEFRKQAKVLFREFADKLNLITSAHPKTEKNTKVRAVTFAASIFESGL